MPFELPDLPYAYDALEPHIDAETMRIHHDLHHGAYVDNANAALEGTQWVKAPSSRCSANLDVAARRQAHRRPQQRRRPREPHPLLADHGPRRRRRPERRPARGDRRRVRQLRRAEGGRDRRRREAFGSGWTWLVWDGTGLAVYSTPNQDSPIIAGRRAAARDRRLGARVLPQVPEQAAGLPRGLVERRQLGRGREAVRGGARAEGLAASRPAC